jgi:hypothetical protein
LTAPPDSLDLSLNEVETLAQKAARGAGLPWGVAEDTGRAAAWIASRVGDWASGLLALLERPPPYDQSPLLLGGFLADSGTPQRLARVVAPLWALPALLGAPARPIAIRLDDTGADIRCNPGEVPGATLSAEALASLPASALTLDFPAAPLPPLPCALGPIFGRSRVPLPEWRRLEALAHRTYVPATDRSRRTGAGAGLLDDA